MFKRLVLTRRPGEKAIFRVGGRKLGTVEIKEVRGKGTRIIFEFVEEVKISRGENDWGDAGNPREVSNG